MAAAGAGVGGAIVVGVTGRGCEPSALRFAADRARLGGDEVVLVHAFHLVPTGRTPARVVTYAQAADAARRVGQEVGEEFAHLTEGSVPHRAVTLVGSPAKVLADLSRGARLVVVQRRHARARGRLFVGSTVNGVAARAYCPVVSVNPEWEEGGTPGEVVVVGVQADGQPRVVLETAFDWAAATGAALRVVHAWRLDDAYAERVPTADVARWCSEHEAVLARALADIGEQHPGVRVSLEVRHQWPADVLVDDSRGASVVVVGRHGWGRWAPSRLGSIARAVLREAECPVVVVPLRAGDGADEHEQRGPEEGR